MDRSSVDDVLDRLGVAAQGVEPLQVVERGNSVWQLDTGDEPLILRRYHAHATVEDVEYEHAVLRHVAQDGWTVPEPATAVLEIDGTLYCVTRFVPGAGTRDETPEGQGRRGRDLARLHLCLRDVNLAQRPGWQCQHEGATVHTSLDWHDLVGALRHAEPLLGDWAANAADTSAAQLAAIGAQDLPVLVVHGDFASWNVHYEADGTFAGVIDFGLTHVDSRPYELAIARTYRAPRMVDVYREELERLGWPMTDHEDAARVPLEHAFRVDMTAWFIDDGIRSGKLDLAMIRRQLERTGTPAP